MHTVHPWIKKTHQHASLILRDPVLGPLTCCPQRWFAEKPRNDAIIAGFMRTKSQWAQWQLHSHVTGVLALPLISPTGRYFHFALLSHFWSSLADRVMLHFLYLIYLLTLERRFVLTKIAPKRIFFDPKNLENQSRSFNLAEKSPAAQEMHFVAGSNFLFRFFNRANNPSKQPTNWIFIQNTA